MMRLFAPWCRVVLVICLALVGVPERASAERCDLSEATTGVRFAPESGILTVEDDRPARIWFDLDNHLVVDSGQTVRAIDFCSAIPGATGTTIRAIHHDGPSLTIGSGVFGSGLNLSSTGTLSVDGDLTIVSALAARADRLTVRGRVFAERAELVADVLELEQLSRITLRERGGGGDIAVRTGTAVLNGVIDVSGERGGRVSITSRTVTQNGALVATGSIGDGGEIAVEFDEQYLGTTNAVILADAALNAGIVRLEGGDQSGFYTSGLLRADGARGGSVSIGGQEIGLVDSNVSAVGRSQGGSIRIGGGPHGAKLAGRTAVEVTLGPTTRVSAGADEGGQGGNIVIWSETATDVDAVLRARAGEIGGAIEVSSRGQLQFDGIALADALLLDPANIVINSATGGLPQYVLNPGITVQRFGTRVQPLPNGNVVVTAPADFSGGRGAAFLFDGVTGALISTIQGGNTGDLVGYGGVTVLSTGNFVVSSPNWRNGSATGAGAATFGNATTGFLGGGGNVSASNSLVGSKMSDAVGSFGGGTSILTLTNGSYVVVSPAWNFNTTTQTSVGAVTQVNGSTGQPVGVVTTTNSLIGSNANDSVGSGGVTRLADGVHYVVQSFGWDLDPFSATNSGAVTWVDGNVGLVGPVSAANSLVGTSSDDTVGQVTALANGNYVVYAAGWNKDQVTPDVGAATFVNGSNGQPVGPITLANSFVGTNANNRIAEGGVVALTDGNYVVVSQSAMINGVLQAGAVTWGNGTTGLTGSPSMSNSLYGTTQNDYIGIAGVQALPAGRYLVRSFRWNVCKGAVTWRDANSSAGVAVGAGNSFVGATGATVNDCNQNQGIADRLGQYPPIVLPNGNYVVPAPYFNGGRGAAALITGATGAPFGAMSSANSLVGSTVNDHVSLNNTNFPGIYPLSNGNYVVTSSDWNGGLTQRGAVTLVNGTTGQPKGAVSAANSALGASNGDLFGQLGVVALNNGSFVVVSPNATMNGIAQAGAVTWLTSTSSASNLSLSNSLYGQTMSDRIGTNPFNSNAHTVYPLANGNYAVASAGYDLTAPVKVDVGAATFGNGTTGTFGPISGNNSVIGATATDQIGLNGITPLPNGDYVVISPGYTSGGLAVAGAATHVLGDQGLTLDLSNPIVIGIRNSLIGTVATASLQAIVIGRGAFYASFITEGASQAGKVRVGIYDPNSLAYATLTGATATLTQNYLSRSLNAGTSVRLQASNDISTAVANGIISSNPTGPGGALTLQAGRSIILPAGITTDDGNFTLIANDRLANGVVNADRLAGNADINVSSTMNAGSGAIVVDLRDGLGKTNLASGSVSLQTVLAGSLTVSSTTTIALNGAVNTGSGPVRLHNVGTLTMPAAGSVIAGGGFGQTGGPTTLSSIINSSAGNGNISFAGAVTLGANVTLNAGTGSVTFGALNLAGFTLNLTSGTPVSFGGTINLGAGTINAPNGYTLASGGSLTGNGTLNGPLIVSSGGSLSPGTSPGAITINGNLTMQPGSTFTAELNGVAANLHDLVTVKGTVSLGGASLATTIGGGYIPAAGDVVKIIDNDGTDAVTGTFAGLAQGATTTIGATTFVVNYAGGDGNDVVLIVPPAAGSPNPLPPVVATDPASNIDLTSGTLNGSVNALNADATAVFEYGTTSGSYPNSVTASPSTASGAILISVSAGLNGLPQGATIFFRLKATNAGGTSVGQERSFVTSALSPTATPIGGPSNPRIFVPAATMRFEGGW